MPTLLFLLLIAGAALAKRPARLLAAGIATGLLLAGLDQSRLQPWFYEYLLLFAALAWFYSSRDAGRRFSALNACRLLLASIYFWSGAQKINPRFPREMFPWIVKPLLDDMPRLAPIAAHAAYAAPVVEIAIGLALLPRRTRPFAAAAAVAMHGFLLLVLGPLGRNHNSVIWPWNLMMIGAVLALFVHTPDVSARAIGVPAGPVLFRAAVAFVVLAPALSFAGIWDNYFSWALYSGNHAEAVFYVSYDLLDRLPDPIADHVYEHTGGPDTLDAAEWSWDELNAPINAEPRIYRAIARDLCRYAEAPNDLRTVIQPRVGRAQAFACGISK